ncbi:MAG: ABC transporter substrate-binding protein [Candidatus Faecousia sp.]|nr:ABC transporter substrate-binding protein [Clostridiales bacterium]MDY6179215.1 ABC transporter substrate-binding protein [Candidatus Faecousia sp.]
MKKGIALLLALALVLSLGACGGKTEAETQAPTTGATETSAVTEAPTENPEVTVTDMIGREVTIIPGSYSRVVCIGAGALRMYSYVGDMNLLCGVEDIDNLSLEDRPKMFDAVARPYVLAYGEMLKELPSCGVGGPQAQTAEAEKILTCNPDIVISEYEDVEKENALQEQLGVPVITLKAGPGGVFDDAFAGSMNLLGQVFGREARAAELVAFVQAETAEISGRTAEIAPEDQPGVYICGLGNWGTTNHQMTAQNYVSFEIANVRNVVTGLSAPGIQAIEAEKFVSLGEDMDILIMDAAAVKNIAPLYKEDPTLFDTCRAWREGEVYLEMAYNAYYTNYEIALLNTWFVAKTVYPELFGDIDLTEKTNEVTKMFLGQELAEAIFACPSSFGGYQKVDTASFFG